MDHINTCTLQNKTRYSQLTNILKSKDFLICEITTSRSQIVTFNTNKVIKFLKVIK